MPPTNNQRNGRRQKRVPPFARTHPFLYKLFLVSAQLTTPLTFLTLASTSGILHRKFSSISAPVSGTTSPSPAYNGFLTPRFPLTSAGTSVSLSSATFSKLRWNLPLNWRKVSVWLWYLSVWSYIARYALIGTSVVWVLSGWEGEGEMVERENVGDGRREEEQGQAA